MGVTDQAARSRPAGTASNPTPARHRIGVTWYGLWNRLPLIGRRTMHHLAVASLVANIVLVATGAAVRLTDSGLGCPTWPRCSSQSLVAHDAMGVHSFIEFGNRLLTFGLTAVAILTFVGAMRLLPAHRSVRRLSLVLLLAIPVQAVVGGISVLSDLNPWVVSVHLLLSLAIIGLAVVLIRRVDETDEPSRPTVPRAVVGLGWVTFTLTWLVLYAGTVVTGSGPHAGNANSPRNGLSPAAVSQLHADLVCLLVGASIGMVFATRACGAPERATRAASWLLGLELAQGVVGFTQYFTGLPVGLVEIHVLGAALISAAAAWMVLGTRERPMQRLTPPDVGLADSAGSARVGG